METGRSNPSLRLCGGPIKNRPAPESVEGDTAPSSRSLIGSPEGTGKVRIVDKYNETTERNRRLAGHKLQTKQDNMGDGKCTTE